MILVNWITSINVLELFFFLTILIPLTLLFVENLHDRQQLSCFPLGCVKVIPGYPVLVKVDPFYPCWNGMYRRTLKTWLGFSIFSVIHWLKDSRCVYNRTVFEETEVTLCFIHFTLQKLFSGKLPDLYPWCLRASPLACSTLHVCAVGQLLIPNRWQLPKLTVHLHAKAVLQVTRMFLPANHDGEGWMGALPWADGGRNAVSDLSLPLPYRFWQRTGDKAGSRSHHPSSSLSFSASSHRVFRRRAG